MESVCNKVVRVQTLNVAKCDCGQDTVWRSEGVIMHNAIEGGIPECWACFEERACKATDCFKCEDN